MKRREKMMQKAESLLSESEILSRKATEMLAAGEPNEKILEVLTKSMFLHNAAAKAYAAVTSDLRSSN